ncbi:ligand-binding sensor domain-containing protein [Draconibacterium halophilum]|uniref:histidine kinase n=1 Tax=Draconibacterium halophilum TaxID=2706887 RepID=A0A6C0RFW1_9BACT|nr:sensor histidine kinase [Draconibacterium halophilum]QIA09029.1 hypothetical protein G0Q07_15480 [Draconibacterium halophilum]
MTYLFRAIKFNSFCLNKIKLVIFNLVVILLVILFSGSLTNTANCQPTNLQFRYLTTDEGLSSSLVISFLQDHNGYMWIGTYNGLNRYDGKRIKVYNNDISDPNSLQCDNVRVIFQDNNNDLFIGTNCGLSYYDPYNDNFINFMTDESSPLYGMGVSVYGIDSSDDGYLWLATDAGLIHFNPTTQAITTYTNDPDNPQSLPDNLVQDVFTDSKNRTWVSLKGGLALFNHETKTFKLITNGANPKNINSENTFLEITEDQQGNVWFASFDGLFCLENSSSENDNLICYRHHPDDPNSISASHLTSLYNDSQNNLWIGAENDGLYRFNREEKNFLHYSSDDYNPKSLNNISIQAINVDNSGNLWVGTFGGGVNISPKNSDAILHYKNIKGAKQSLSNNVVSTIYEDSKNRMWIGTDGGGLNLFNKRTKRFTRFNESNSGFSSNVILSIKEDKNQRLWLGTWNGGIIKFDPDKGNSAIYSIKNSKIPDNSIFSIVMGENNDLWLGSFRAGLIHFDIEKNEFHSYNQSNSAIVGEYISVIRKYKQDKLILGTTNGFSIFSTKNKTFTNYPFEQGDPNCISHNSVHDIVVENDTSIWIGTQSGLNRFNPESKVIKKYFEKDGLPNNVIRGLVLGNDGILWVTTAAGVCKFDCNNKENSNNKYETFTKDDGLQGNEFYFKSTLLAENGKLYLGGMNGFNVISPDRIMQNTNIPEVTITEFEIFNKPVVPNTPGSPLKKIISETEKITLNHHQSVLTFSFAAMDFTTPQKNQYAYKLEDFDKNWTYSGNRSKVTYTNLDPGDYLLKVKGTNNNGVWNEKATILEIEILPPWWLTIWFKLIVLLFGISLIVTFFYLRTATLRKQKRQLAQEVRERTYDLKEKNRLLIKKSDELIKTNDQLTENQKIIKNQSEELKVTAENLEEINNELTSINATKDKLFSVIAHDLKNPFNIILGFSELLINNFHSWDDEQKLKTLTFLNNSSNEAYTLLENLLHWSRSQGKKIEFAPSEINVANFIDNVLNNVSSVATNKNVKLLNLCTNKNLSVHADQNLLTIVCHNLLTNAIKFSLPNSKIVVNAENYTNEFVQFSVRDEGVGISKEKVKTLFNLENTSSTKGTDGEKGTGLGLMICKEFVTYHQGEIGVESEINKGTTFFFTIPKHQAI